MKINSKLKEIIALTEEQAVFWAGAEGWAPIEAAQILSKSRLDWQVSLSKSLQHWAGKKNLSNGDLILAWVNLGSLVEGAMKLFLSVHFQDYKSSLHSKKDRKGLLINPDQLTLEKLKEIFKKEEIIKEFDAFVDLVQKRRNAIHAFKNRDIGNYSEFCKALYQYKEFILELDGRLPYP